VKGYPLVVAVGLAQAEVLAEVERHRLIYYAVAAFVSLLILAFMATIVRRQVGLQRAKDRLWEAANLDALTKLPKRNRVDDLVSAAMAGPHSHNGRFAAFLLDLDNFKFINDTLGHEAGDLVLRSVAKRIKRVARGAEIVARLGGDEFAVLLRNVSERAEIE